MALTGSDLLCTLYNYKHQILKGIVLKVRKLFLYLLLSFLFSLSLYEFSIPFIDESITLSFSLSLSLSLFFFYYNYRISAINWKINPQDWEYINIVF